MARYIHYELDDGSVVLVENTETGGTVKTTRGVADEGRKKFSEAVKAIKPLCAQIKNDFQSLEGDETEVSFALKTTGDLDFAVAKLGAEANFQITLKWKKAAG